MTTKTVRDWLKELGFRFKFTMMEDKDQDEFLSAISKTTDPVLITGKTGTGKELLARALHKASERIGEFIPVNCGGANDNLVLADLFGTEPNAYTGAVRKMGAVESANNGTLFLDEIGDASPYLQTVLLRFLDSKDYNENGFYEFNRLGDEIKKPRTSDLRIIFATNKDDLCEMIDKGSFRLDLYNRINSFPIPAPAMPTDKKKKYQLIVWTLGTLAKGCKAGDRPDVYLYPEMVSLIRSGKKFFTAEAEKMLMDYAFPGNRRELNRVLKYSLVKIHGASSRRKKRIITKDDLHPDILADKHKQTSDNIVLDTPNENFIQKLNELFMQKYVMLSKEYKGNKSQIARALGLPHQNRLDPIIRRGGLYQIKS